MSNLIELFDNVVEFQNYNGVPLAAGKLYVYALGRTRLMDTWSDVDGESLNPNPIILDDLGQCHCYCSDDYDYTLVVCDQFDNEIFSVDKYLLSKGEHSHADVAVAPSEHIGVSSYHVGEVTVYVPYLTGEVGKTYEGIDPIVVNNTLNRISANHIPLGVQDPLYFVQDDEEGCIIGFSGQTVPEGVMTESALGFENNKITGYNGSAFSAGNEYEAGNYISIDNNVINVTGLSPVPADMASTGLVAEVSADIISQIPSTAGLATTAQLDEKLDKSDSANFYPMEGNPSGFLTAHQSLQGYATEQWVEDKGYLTGVDIPESATWNATTQTVSANSAAWAGGTANPQIPVTSTSGISIFESGDKVYFNISADYALADDLTGKQDSLTFGYHDTAISSIDGSAIYDNSAHARINTLAGRISDLSSNKLDATAFSDVSGTFLTALPQDLVYTADIADMATTGQVAEKLDTTAFSTVSGDFLTAHQDLSDYQTTAGMTAYQPVGSYLTADALDSVSGDWNQVTAKLDTTAFSDVSGTFLTAHQDISNKLDTTAFSDVSGNFLTAIPDTYLQNTDLSTEDGKVTAISGIPLSAGGSDVPEGVMVESGLEYNAVQEISGYNGSAIAQYGAEKQWLVTDDTLLTLSNSAQFALGVNISAVQQLMGIDETVLFESPNATGTDLTNVFNLSESMANFNKVKVVYRLWNEGFMPNWFEFDYNNREGNSTKNISDVFTLNPLRFIGASFNFSANNSFVVNEIRYADASFSTQTLDKARGAIYKVIGIGRKQ